MNQHQDYTFFVFSPGENKILMYFVFFQASFLKKKKGRISYSRRRMKFFSQPYSRFFKRKPNRRSFTCPINRNGIKAYICSICWTDLAMLKTEFHWTTTEIKVNTGLCKCSVPLHNGACSVTYCLLCLQTLSISNAASGVNFVTKQSAAHARVSSTGAVNWGPLGTYETTCRLDITFYPFDTQACDVVVDLWSSRESEVRTKAHSYTIAYIGYNTTVLGG